MFRLSLAILIFPALSAAALAEDKTAASAALADIQATMGGVPTFVKSIATPALPGIWAQEKALILSPDTALDAKTKALISLAVSAQIPCDYCIFSDTADARRAGASDQEIAEAVAVAGLTRNVSTVLNGMQVDFATYKAEMSGN